MEFAIKRVTTFSFTIKYYICRGVKSELYEQNLSGLECLKQTVTLDKTFYRYSFMLNVIMINHETIVIKCFI